MTERERLLAILKIPIYPHELVDPAEAVADFLLDNGVKVPVLCRDCKWYQESKLLSPNKFCYRLKDRSGERVGYNFSDDDFCSYGERMESNP